MTMRSFQNEKKIAEDAIVSAMTIARRIQGEFSRNDMLTKEDRSPVTIADFAVQAVVCKILADRLGPVAIVGEENSEALKKGENRELLEKVPPSLSTGQERLTPSSLFELIDLARASCGESFWTLDPIDGTKGFLRGDQYALALALVEGGCVRVGILGCPRLIRIAPQPLVVRISLSAVRGQRDRGGEPEDRGAKKKSTFLLDGEWPGCGWSEPRPSSHHDPRTLESLNRFPVSV